MIYRFIVRNTVEQRLVELAAREESDAGNFEEIGMSDELSHQLLERPDPMFRFRSDDQEDDGLDEDELWWNTEVQGKTRLEHLAPFLASDSGEQYELLHGVEVPKAAVRKILGLKRQNIEID